MTVYGPYSRLIIAIHTTLCQDSDVEFRVILTVIAMEYGLQHSHVTSSVDSRLFEVGMWLLLNLCPMYGAISEQGTVQVQSNLSDGTWRFWPSGIGPGCLNRST